MVVEILHNTSKQAAEFFDRGNLFCYSQEEIDEVLAVYDYVVENPHLQFSPCLLLYTVSPILMGIFLQVLRKVMEDSEHFLFQSLKYLIQAFQE